MAAIGSLAFTAASPGNAALILTIDDLATVGVDVIVLDQTFAGGVATGAAAPKAITTGPDGNTTLGAVTFSGTIGVFTVALGVGTSKPLIGNPFERELDLFGFALSSGAGELEIMLTDTDFDPIGADHSKVFLDVGGLAQGTVLSEALLDSANVPFGGTTSLPSITGGPGPFSGSSSLKIEPAIGVSFSISQNVNVTHTGAGTTNFNSRVTVVPEPTTLSLMGLGLLGAGAIAWRRRKAPKSAA